MNFPDTPRTLLARLKTRAMPNQWETSWNEFYNIYHDVTRICVRNYFFRKGWHSVCDADLSDVVMRVICSIHNGGDTLDMDFSKGYFRQLLTTLCQRRVVDFIREQQKYRHDISVPVEAGDSDALTNAAAMAKYQADEASAFRVAAAMTLFAALKHEVSPQILMIFERVKLLNERPSEVAEELGIKRGGIDNSIHKAMNKLREIAARPEINKEF